ncbi:MAG: cell division protein FtsQ/DivIB [Bauldia sp.]
MRSVAALAMEPLRASPPVRLRLPGYDGVLPPILRRPARLLSRLDVELPRRFGLKATAALLLATGIYGVVLGGHVGSITGTLTAAVGLRVDAVTITGQSETAELDVLEALALPEHNSIVMFDADAARERVESLPWVADAVVRKVYPSTVEVAITERVPYALWQNGGAIALIDENGAIISNYVAARYTALPMVVGAGASEEAAPILTLLSEFPDLAAKVRAATLVAGRRWNLTMRNGITVLLPEDDLLPALIQLVSLDQSAELLARDIVAVDLRMSDRVTVQLTADVLEAVEDTVTEARRNGV